MNRTGDQRRPASSDDATADRGRIEMYHVDKDYDLAPALRDVSLRIQSGAFVFVMGPSGAGKSTLLSLMAGLERPSAGRVLVGGRDVSALRGAELTAMRRRVGLVFQDCKLLPDRTCLENVALALEIRGWDRGRLRSRAEAALKVVGLEARADSLPPTMSGGEQQRTALARALVGQPPIVLADEPTGNLDWEMSREIVKLLKMVNDRGTTVVVATHDRELVRSVPSGVLSLDRGRVVGVET